MKKRTVLRTAGLIVLLLLIVAAGAWWWLTRSGLPARSGSFELPGLEATVTVRWDRWGVPNIEAASLRDASAALGYLHANDRMTQLEIGRRAASGRLSEVLGEITLDYDRGMRKLRLRRAAETLWQSAGPESKEALEAYAAGVNAWLDERGSRLPPTLELLGIEPEPWQPVDSLCFALLMAQDLSFWNDRPEEERFRWLRTYGVDRTLDVIGDGVLPPAAEIEELARASSELRSGRNAAEPGPDASPGSNNWAVGGSRSASGAPLVANDPHLGLRLPGVWYQALIRAPDYEVAGMTLPGLPGVVVGRTEHLAWAVTNVMLDDHDLFFEALDPSGTQVRRGDGWAPITVETEDIGVKGAAPVTLELRSTDIGPLFAAEPEIGLPARSLAWTAYLPADPLLAFLRLARAHTLEDVPAAISSYVGPAQNLVVAQRDGGLLYTVLGRVPERKSGDGRLPAPAWDPAYGWSGLRPTDLDPKILRPEDDLLVTANNDIRPPGYDQPLSADFDVSSRRDRIRELLLAQPTWTVAGMGKVQTDHVSLFANEVLGLCSGEYPGDAGRAFAVLAAWNGSMDVEGPSALYALFERHLIEGIFNDESEHDHVPSVYERGRLERILQGTMDPVWFDDVETPDTVETRRQVVEAALAAAWTDGVARWGEDVAAWKYGELHTLTLRHPAGSAPVIGRFFNRGPMPMIGSATTVAAFGGGWRGDRQPVTYGPSMRWLVDLANPDGGLAVLPGGQSGHPWDEHYDDQLRPYLDGELHPVPWTDAAITAATVSTLTLRPAASSP
ncbi:MAG: penicillin acylase family protein [Acidobacteria bacterium]|nr:penicillin acylase family protein [Acidobacteriota bacterium]